LDTVDLYLFPFEKYSYTAPFCHEAQLLQGHSFSEEKINFIGERQEQQQKQKSLAEG